MGRWLLRMLTLAAALGTAILALQAPAVTDECLTALDQIAIEARRDVDQTIAAARQRLRIAATDDDRVIAAIRARDPKAADQLAAEIGRARALRDDQQRLATQPTMLRPALVAWDAWRAPEGYKRAVLESVLQRRDLMTVHLDSASAPYGLAGLVVGWAAASLVLAVLGRLFGRRGLLRRRQVDWYVPQRPPMRRIG